MGVVQENPTGRAPARRDSLPECARVGGRLVCATQTCEISEPDGSSGDVTPWRAGGVP